MTDYPPTPACIRAAIGTTLKERPYCRPEDVCDAVWHALCDEGFTGYLRDGSSVLYRREVENAQHGLWIPLPNKETP